MRGPSRAASGWPPATIPESPADPGQRGAVAVLVVLVLPLLVVTAGLVVDVAYLFGVRAQLQAAADLAALAAAQNVDLEALAGGERRILEDAAAADARQWVRFNLAANPFTARYQELAEVQVIVYNAAPDRPLRQHWTGRTLTDPTVSVRVSMTVPTYLLRGVVPSVEVAALADASLLEKADPLE